MRKISIIRFVNISQPCSEYCLVMAKKDILVTGKMHSHCRCGSNNRLNFNVVFERLHRQYVRFQTGDIGELFLDDT